MKNALKILTISTLLILNFNLKSQCTQVCGTVTAKGTFTSVPTGTQNVNVVNTPTVHVNNTTFTAVPTGTQTTTYAGTQTVNINNTTFTSVPTGTQTTTYAGTQTVNINNTSFSVTGTPTFAIQQNTLTSSATSVTTSGDVTAGAKGILFETSSDFTGTIDGLLFQPNGFLSYPISPGTNYPDIPYTVTAGTLYIRKFN